MKSFARGIYPDLSARGVEVVQGDLANADAVLRAARECEVVFHVAAKAGLWGRAADFFNANVAGTDNVIRACQQAGIARLVYTSSPSVVFDGRDMEGVNESVPYALTYRAHYPRTKALAEQRLLAANSRLAGDRRVAPAPALGTARHATHQVDSRSGPFGNTRADWQQGSTCRLHLHRQCRAGAPACSRQTGARSSRLRKAVLRFARRACAAVDFYRSAAGSRLASAGATHDFASRGIWRWDANGNCLPRPAAQRRAEAHAFPGRRALYRPLV